MNEKRNIIMNLLPLADASSDCEKNIEQTKPENKERRKRKKEK